ncbi:hypothetical protein DFA_02754 [Cavenderia fasciculata]|uniref:ELYS-like domain-containing protein n=1 Tax=Cavenderia fasciculata TaxID=261658 RepID=F4PI24_CACFS|nr:uncharacterized protein DFA_02754 [Cavenderia fasciculata]EGG24511.1 hypothetical protein DFA_02754 [Cavenderia fasciculata]|eukprot:XP_004362362.1 hypothetical protein DFA_02754 [Cavenderia fasciculata]
MDFEHYNTIVELRPHPTTPSTTTPTKYNTSDNNNNNNTQQQQQQSVADKKHSKISSTISSDGKWCWYHHENQLFLYDSTTGRRLTTWCFVESNKELNILTVTELNIFNRIYLLCAVGVSHSQSHLKILDVQHAMTIRTITLPFAVSFIRQLVSADPISSDDCIGRFKCPVVIGAKGGQSLIVDIDFNPRDLSLASINRQYSIKAVDVKTYNGKTFWEGNKSSLYPCVLIGSGDGGAANNNNNNQSQSNNNNNNNNNNNISSLPSTDNHRFDYPYIVETDYVLHNRQDIKSQIKYIKLSGSGIYVTAITYIPSIQALAIGYNMGCFQLFSTHNGTLNLVYSSPYKEFEHRFPVTHFLFQELEDDMDSSSSYLWVGRGNLISNNCQVSIILYKLDFIKSSTSSMSVIKSIDILQSIENQQLNITSSFIGTIFKMDYFFKQNELVDNTPKSKSIFIYQTQDQQGYQRLEVKIFDLSRFEKFGKETGNPSKWLYQVQLNNNIQNNVMNCWIDKYSISRNIYNPFEDEMDAPLSLSHPSFDLYLLQEDSVKKVHYLNPQEHAVDAMAKNGTLTFSNPQPLFSKFIEHKIFSFPRSEPALQTNDFILFALDNNMFSLIIDYITNSTVTIDFNGKEKINYFLTNPKMVLDITWEFFENLESSINVADIFSVGQGEKATREKLQDRLEMVYVKMMDTFSIVDSLCERYKTENNTNEITSNLERMYKTILQSTQHLEVLKWALTNDLLTAPVQAQIDKVSALVSLKRSNNKQLLSTLGQEQENSPLFIDILFKRISKHDTYPPSSTIEFKKFLDLFKSSNKFTKLVQILFYLLLDLDTIERLPSNLLSSLQNTFCISPDDISFIQGIWGLDSANLYEDIQLSMNDSYRELNSSTKSKKYGYEILSRFYANGSHMNALFFMKSIGFDPKDIQQATLAMKILLSNDSSASLMEAIIFERNFRKKFNTLELDSIEKLLYLLFDFCTKKKKLDKLMEMPLDDIEDQCFVHYLYGINASKLVPIYMIRRGRIVEGCNVQRKLQRTDILQSATSSSSSSSSQLSPSDQLYSMFMDNFSSSIPSLQKNAITQEVPKSDNFYDFDIPDEPLSIRGANSNTNECNVPSFGYQPFIRDHPVPKLYNDSDDLKAQGDVGNFKGFTKIDRAAHIEPFNAEAFAQQHDDAFLKGKDIILDSSTMTDDHTMHDDDDSDNGDDDDDQDFEFSQSQETQTPKPVLLKSALKNAQSPSSKRRVQIQESKNIMYPIESKEDVIASTDEDTDDEDDYNDDDDERFDDADEDQDENLNYYQTQQHVDHDDDDDDEMAEEDSLYGKNSSSLSNIKSTIRSMMRDVNQQHQDDDDELRDSRIYQGMEFEQDIGMGEDEFEEVEELDEDGEEDNYPSTQQYLTKNRSRIRELDDNDQEVEEEEEDDETILAGMKKTGYIYQSDEEDYDFGEDSLDEYDLDDGYQIRQHVPMPMDGGTQDDPFEILSSDEEQEKEQPPPKPKASKHQATSKYSYDNDQDEDLSSDYSTSTSSGSPKQPFVSELPSSSPRQAQQQDDEQEQEQEEEEEEEEKEFNPFVQEIIETTSSKDNQSFDEFMQENQISFDDIATKDSPISSQPIQNILETQASSSTIDEEEEKEKEEVEEVEDEIIEEDDVDQEIKEEMEQEKPLEEIIDEEIIEEAAQEEDMQEEEQDEIEAEEEQEILDRIAQEEQEEEEEVQETKEVEEQEEEEEEKSEDDEVTKPLARRASRKAREQLSTISSATKKKKSKSAAKPSTTDKNKKKDKKKKKLVTNNNNNNNK